MNSIWNIFWIFIIVVSLLPMIQQKPMAIGLFPQAAARRPSVRYIPVPCKKTADKEGRK